MPFILPHLVQVDLNHMQPIPNQLKLAAKKVYGPNKTRPVKVRTFLSWFWAKRRGVQVASEIRSALIRSKLVTEPDFMTAHIDDRIRLKPTKPPNAELASKLQRGSEEVLILKQRFAKPMADSPELAATVEAPIPRVGTIFGTVPVVSVKPEDSIRKATSEMLNKEFSQLPVMSNTRKVDGMVSWKSIGEEVHLHRKNCKIVKECMEREVEILPHDTHLWKAIKKITEHEVVLIRGENDEIIRLVTTSDLATRYHMLAEPFLLLSEIENNLRRLITLANFPLALLVSMKNSKGYNADNNRCFQANIWRVCPTSRKAGQLEEHYEKSLPRAIY